MDLLFLKLSICPLRNGCSCFGWSCVMVFLRERDLPVGHKIGLIPLREIESSWVPPHNRRTLIFPHSFILLLMSRVRPRTLMGHCKSVQSGPVGFNTGKGDKLIKSQAAAFLAVA